MVAINGFLSAISISCSDIGNCSPQTKTLESGFANIAHVLIVLIGMLAIVFIIFSGFLMVMSNGDSKRFQQGRESLQYAVIGVALSIAAYALVSFLAGSFN